MRTSAISIENALRQVVFFANLPADQIALLRDSCRVQTYLRKDFVFQQGDAGHTLYVVLEGLIGIQRTGQDFSPVHIATRGPGEFFGELSLLDGEPRSADAVALADSTLLSLSRERFLFLLSAAPSLARHVMETLGKRLREAAELTAMDRGRDLPERVFVLLRDMARSANPGARIRISQSEIAERVGAVRTSVCRAVGTLRDRGAIDYRSGGYQVLDWTFVPEDV